MYCNRLELVIIVYVRCPTKNKTFCILGLMVSKDCNMSEAGTIYRGSITDMWIFLLHLLSMCFTLFGRLLYTILIFRVRYRFSIGLVLSIG